jgi:replicative DNA helicase
MGVTEVANRLVSAIGRVHMSEIIRPVGISKGSAINIKTALGVIGRSKIKVWDDSKISMDFIEAQIEENDGADMIVVDYIQLVEGVKSKTDSREQEVARISKQLKQLAKKFGCPVITASQLNDDGRVRESRAIAHDADIVLQIKPDEGIFVAKNRNGQRGIMLPLKMVGEFQRFETQYQ